MIFYSLLLFTFVLLGITEFFGEKKEWRKFVLILIKSAPFIILFLLAVLKKDTVGYDSVSYHNWYDTLLSGKNPGGSYQTVEKGFKLLIEFFAKINTPYIVFLVACNLIIYLPTCIVFIKLSKNCGFSAFIYACLSIMVLNFSALRQAMSIGLCLLSLLFTLKKKWWSCIISFLLIIIAGSFHNAGFVFLVTIPIVYVPISKNIIKYLLPLGILFFVVTPPLVMALYYSVLYGSPYYPITRDGVGEYYFFFLLIFVVFYLYENSLWFRNKIRSIFCCINNKIAKKDDNPNNFQVKPKTNKSNYLLILFFIGVLFQSTSQINYAFPRFATQFLAIISIVSINILLNEKHKLTRNVSLVLFLSGFYLFFIYDSILPNYLGFCPYQFFWM